MRHKKFETLEKRQRFREKEKLQHERYKLKQRIEQLRTMDASTFAATLAVSGHADPVDGERKRRELLREAEELERRYDMLLSDKKDQNGTDHPLSREEVAPPVPLKLKFKLGQSLSRTPSHERPLNPSHEDQRHGAYQSRGDSLPTAPSSPTKSSVRERSGHSSSHTASPTKSPNFSYPSIISESAEKRIKRQRSSLPTIRPLPPGYIPDILRVAAPPNASRTTLRHTLAFGVKIPSLLDELVEFRLPQEWVDEAEGNRAEMDVASDEETLGLVSTVFEMES